MRTSLITLFLAGCTCSAKSPTSVNRPDVLVIVVDTLRQDRVGVYGYKRDTTPHIDQIAKRGTRFAQARSTSTWTTPAHASLFTGLYPRSHGATQERWDLTEDHDTLAELLKRSGYRTIAAVSNPMLARKRGFAQGFEEYHEAWRHLEDGVTMDEAGTAWLEHKLQDRSQSHPQFVFVNLMGVHSSYDSCGEHCGTFGATVTPGPVANGWQDYYLGRITHDPQTIRRLSDLYDAEVLHVDHLIGQIVNAFRDAAGNRPTLVVITSDHGENIGEHGHFDHVFSLYETTVRVPLILWGAAVPTNEVQNRPVQLHDLFATILKAAGLRHKSHGMPVWEVPADRPVLAEYYRPIQASGFLMKIASASEKARLAKYQRRLRAQIRGNSKPIWADDGHREAYDLADDPLETRDLVAQENLDVSSQVERLLTLVNSLERHQHALPRATVDNETREALRALGYLE